MTALDCWICTTPPRVLTRRALETLCACGFEVQHHGYGHPHSLSGVGCPAFTAALPLPKPHSETDAQPALF
jgi:hypothetical protein